LGAGGAVLTCGAAGVYGHGNRPLSVSSGLAVPPAETFNSQISQKPLNLGLAHVAGMLEVMKMNEVFDPIDISLFGSDAIVLVANLLTQLIQQPG